MVSCWRRRRSRNDPAAPRADEENLERQSEHYGTPSGSKWAVYEKRYLDRLLEDVSQNLEELEKLFPQARVWQRELNVGDNIKIEAAPEDGDALRLIQETSEQDGDMLLAEASARAREQTSGHTWSRTSVSDEAEVHHEFKGRAVPGAVGNNYGETIITRKARAHQGDLYGFVQLLTSV
jgi:hypothetical protein